MLWQRSCNLRRAQRHKMRSDALRRSSEGLSCLGDSSGPTLSDMNIIYEPFQERKTGMTWPSLSIHLSHKSKSIKVNLMICQYLYNSINSNQRIWIQQARALATLCDTASQVSLRGLLRARRCFAPDMQRKRCIPASFAPAKNYRMNRSCWHHLQAF